MQNTENSSNSSKGPEGGNTKPPQEKKKQISPKKHWCFTHPNYTEEDIAMWKKKALDPNVELLVFQTEMAPSTGLIHLQGTISFHDKVRPLNEISSKKVHWEPRKGNKQQSCLYCVKLEEVRPEPYLKFCHGWRAPEIIRTITPDRWWQQEIIKIVEEEPDDRTIHWYWSEAGGIGKTAMLKYLNVHYGAIPCSGKGADMRNAIRDYAETNGYTPKIIIVPIPRSFSVEYLSFEGIEQAKDMIFYSGKYEGGVVCGNPPHLIVLANVAPDESKMSADRWHVVCID